MDANVQGTQLEPIENNEIYTKGTPNDLWLLHGSHYEEKKQLYSMDTIRFPMVTKINKKFPKAIFLVMEWKLVGWQSRETAFFNLHEKCLTGPFATTTK